MRVRYVSTNRVDEASQIEWDVLRGLGHEREKHTKHKARSPTLSTLIPPVLSPLTIEHENSAEPAYAEGTMHWLVLSAALHVQIGKRREATQRIFVRSALRFERSTNADSAAVY